MTSTTLSPATSVSRARERAIPEPIPFGRILGVELRKMFDTRSGFWLMASIVIASVLATGATIIFAPDSELTYETFAAAIGFPMSVILPMVAVLSVTSEWSQRSALTTFTLVPGRLRVVSAKLIGTVSIGVVSMLVAAVVGALGNVVGTAIAGVDTTWNVELGEFVLIILANVIGMLMGFMLGVLIRNSPGAIVGYFVYALVLPTISSALIATQEWYRDNVGWLDFNYATSQLFNHSITGEFALSGEQWAQLGVTAVFWLLIPLAVGLRMMLRSEVN